MSTDTLPLLPALDDRAITTETTTTLAQTEALTVRDGATYALAGERVTGLRALSKSIEAFFADDVKRAHELWKSLTGKRKALIDPIEAQVTRLGREMARYAQEQEQAQRKEQERLQREVLELERAAALAEAAAAESEGLVDEAGAMLDALMAPAVPIVVAASAPAVATIAGVSYRETWKHRVVDVAKVPREYMLINEAAIAKVVAATKGAVQIPGVEIYTEKTPVIGARR